MCSTMLSSVKLAQNIFPWKTGTTSHLWAHLHKTPKFLIFMPYPKEEDAKVKTYKTSSLEASTSEPILNFFVIILDASTKKRYDTAVLKFIVGDERPFDSVAECGFKYQCSVLTNGSYNPSHPTALLRQIDDMNNALHYQL